jgi:hypothetical protein
MKNASDKNCSKTGNTHFMFNNFFSENRALYKIMWKNIVEPDGAQMTIWRMRLACWITNATNTLRICNTYCFFPLQQWLHERTSMLRYTYPIACLVLQIRLLQLVMERESYRYFDMNISHGFSATVNPNKSACLRR